MIEDASVLIKYNGIWNIIKKTLKIKFHSMPVFDKIYIKAEVKEFGGVVNTNIWGDKVPKEIVHLTCIACISIDSILTIEKKELPTSLFRRMQV